MDASKFYDMVCLKLKNISDQEKSPTEFIGKSLDKWFYKCKYDDSDGHHKYIAVLRLLERNDRKNKPVYLLLKSGIHVLDVGEEVQFEITSTDYIMSKAGVYSLKYFRNARQNDQTDVGSIAYDLQTYNTSGDRPLPGSMAYDVQVFSTISKRITLVASDGTELPISNFIFMARSEVFRAMFLNDTVEKRENRVHFKDMASDVLEKLVMFLTTDRVDQMDDNTAYHLGLLCHQYGLPLLFKQVENYFCQNCNEQNAPLVTELIHLHQSKKLAIAFGHSTD